MSKSKIPKIKKEFTRHIPVLLQSVLEQLDLKKGQIFVDCNLGDGGHSEEIAKTLDGDITIIGFDLDQDAIARAGANFKKAFVALKKKPKIIFINDNFRNLKKALDEGVGIASAPVGEQAGQAGQAEQTERGTKVAGQVDAILYDLGLSSYELEESGRGFSFRKDEPLLMTFTNSASSADSEGTTDTAGAGFTAEEIINEWDEENIKTIIESYGEDKFAYRIAKAIVKARAEEPIKTTSKLAEIIKMAVPSFARFGKTHPATKTFQALRIAVNDELSALSETLPQAIEKLNQEGRLVVISYHSLEDRIVKNIFKKFEEDGLGKILTKRPIVPTESEIEENPRSRSAKLRVFKKKI